MKTISGSIAVLIVFSFTCVSAQPRERLAEKKEIYRNGWIDLNKNGKMDVYENSSAPINERVNDLLNQMNIEEKTCQMATLYGFGRILKDELPHSGWLKAIWKDGIANIDEHLNGLDRKETKTEYSWPPSKHAMAINEVQRFFVEYTRLGIPVDFTNEGIRGVCHEGGTSFPSGQGLGSTWDPELIFRIGKITGEEGKSLGYTNIYSPILDLARDPRWGRVVECYGEDPFLVAQIGLAQIKGIQSQGIASTTKHFAVYSVPKGGRDGDARTDPHVTPREMEEIFLYPFKLAFMEGKAMGTMSSYNDYNGIPITASREFLIDRLRKEWGFEGYVVSDSKAVEYIYTKHHVAANPKEAVRMAVEAGLNVRTEFSPPDDFILPLRELVKEGNISLTMLDSRVADVLKVKFRLGLFDKPYIEDPQKADNIVGCKENQETAYEASLKSIVLLKNQNNLLPLKKEIKSILVTGPNAAAKNSSVSRYGPNKIDVISILDGIKEKAADKIEVKYTKGCEIIDKNFPESEIIEFPMNEAEKLEIEKAREMAKTVDAIIVVVGDDERIVGESKSRTSLDLPGYQNDLVKALQETGKPVIAVLINGRPLSINWIDKNVPAIVEAWFPGKWGGRAVADVLFGDYNPGGKLTTTFPKSVGQLPMDFPFKPASDLGDPTGVDGVLYPFGFGLSYTSFHYSGLALKQDNQSNGGSIYISFEIENTGRMEGDEIAQLYINDETTSVTQYVKMLRGFKRITLKPGEKKKVEFVLTRENLSILNREMKRVVEPGIFKVFIGSSSADMRLNSSFEFK